MKRSVLELFLLLVLAARGLFGIDNLELNQRQDYQSDSLDGPLITGDDAQAGFVPRKNSYIIIYADGYFNSKRQARGTIELYNTVVLASCPPIVGSGSRLLLFH